MTGTDTVLGELRSQWEAAHTEATKITDNPKSSAELLAKANKLFDDRDKIGAKIEDRKATLDQIEGLKSRGSDGESWSRQPNRTMPFSGEKAGNGFQFGSRIEPGQSELDKREKSGGFKSLGHFAWAMYKRGPDGRGDPSAVLAMKDWNDLQFDLMRKDLQLKTPSGMYEVSDPDGGDLIPIDFSNQVYTRMVTKNQILALLNPIPISGNQLTIPALLEDSRVDGKRGGGVLGYWTGEASQYTSSKSRLRTIDLKLHKLTVMTFITDELMQDSAGAIQRFLLDKAPAEINFKINDAVINGTGSGMPFGLMKSTSKVTVAAVSGQGAATIVWTNIPTMWQRLVAGQRSTAVWLYNQDCESNLSLLFMPTGTAAGIAIFRPNENRDGGYTLYNRPALVMEQCQTCGTEGDLILFSPEGIACITKGSIESFMSMHLRFDFDEACFKWRFRMDAQPYDLNALTPFNGSNTVSSIVTLNSTRT